MGGHPPLIARVFDQDKEGQNQMRFAPRKIVQILCGLLGILGLIWIYCGVRFIADGIADHEFRGIIFSPIFFILGGITVAVAYQSIFKYSERAINNISKVAGFLIFGVIGQWTRMQWDAAWNRKDMPGHLAWGILPLVLAWIFYRLIKFVLFKFTIENKS